MSEGEGRLCCAFTGPAEVPPIPPATGVPSWACSDSCDAACDATQKVEAAQMRLAARRALTRQARW